MPRIYDELTPEQAIQGGYFQPKESWNRLSNNNYVHTLRKDKITKETKVLYFPGSFGTFHEGHKAVVNSALSNFSLSKGDDYVIVISPANADYLVEKYGANCEFAMNTPRFNAMKDLVTEDNNYVIDMNPMLNHRCDQNFTDLLDDYLNQYGLGIDEMTHKPVILCGKDRTDFINLNKYTDKIFVFSGGTKFDTTGQTFSTSKIEKVYRDKKNLVLRVNTDAEFNLFVDYFGEYYKAIALEYIEAEIELATLFAMSLGIKYTICKEYAGFCEYVPMSRDWTNPFVSGSYTDAEVLKRIPEGERILDSDAYTGGTRNHLQNLGYNVHVLIDLEKATTDYELLDISDFYKDGFDYPFVDVSERCSLPAFDLNMHEKFIGFKKELKELKND